MFHVKRWGWRDAGQGQAAKRGGRRGVVWLPRFAGGLLRALVASEWFQRPPRAVERGARAGAVVKSSPSQLGRLLLEWHLQPASHVIEALERTDATADSALLPRPSGLRCNGTRARDRPWGPYRGRLLRPARQVSDGHRQPRRVP